MVPINDALRLGIGMREGRRPDPSWSRCRPTSTYLCGSSSRWDPLSTVASSLSVSSRMKSNQRCQANETNENDSGVNFSCFSMFVYFRCTDVSLLDERIDRTDRTDVILRCALCRVGKNHYFSTKSKISIKSIKSTATASLLANFRWFSQGRPFFCL